MLDKNDGKNLMLQRLDRVRSRIIEKDLQGILVYSRENTLYLSGFTGSESMLIVTPEQALLLTDFRYLEQAGEQCPHFKIIDNKPDMFSAIRNNIPEGSVFNLGIEEDSLSYNQGARLREMDNIVLQPFQDFLLEMRSVKDGFEISKMRQAAKIAEKALENVLPMFRPGTSESGIAAALEYEMRKLGASGPSFTTIIASGPRSALPHGVASERIMQAGEAVVVDFGCIWQGYCSDMTRTFFLGQPEEEALEVYDLVLAAHLAALKVLRPGIMGSDADKIARDIIGQAGYGAAFGHSLGHGVGLAVHEAPRLSHAGCYSLSPGHVVTVEPGIYLPGRFGVRIEDTVVIEEQGAASFNSFDKKLPVLPV